MLVAWMDCLADPTRLRLLRLLERHELGVVELCDVLQLPQSTVSRHLKVLGDLGWVRSRRQGTTNLYRMILDELESTTRRLWLVAREQVEEWPAVQHDQLRLTRRLREKQGDSQQFFAGAAARWDKLRGELYGEGFNQAAMLALLPKETVVADLGCGTGKMAAALAPFVKKVIAVDNSPAMLKAAQRRTADFANVELKRGDLEHLPLEDDACDAAMLLLALTYVAEPAAAIQEMARILRPGGKAIVVDLLPHDRDDFRRQMEQQWMGFPKEELERIMQEAGLTEIRWQELPPEEGAKGPGLFLAVGAVK
jgi:ArsR family transcriptional regulator